MTAMTEDVCTDCGKERLITLRYKAGGSIEVDGVTRQGLIDIKLCKGCMRNRAQAAKRTQHT
jgi:hypothetical protein